MANQVISLRQAQTRDLLPLESRGPGVYEVKLLLEGNSLLSTLWVKTIDGGASVSARYYDVTSGRGDGEQGTLPSHPVATVASTGHSKITVTPFHNNPVLEVTVAGGNAEFSIWGTVVSSFATDIGAALVFDQSTFVPTVTKGIPIVGLDRVQNKLFMINVENGVIPVSQSEAGDNVHMRYNGVTDGTEQELLTRTVPVGKKMKVTVGRIVCRAHVVWELVAINQLLVETIIGAGATNPARPVDTISYSPREDLPANTVLKLRAKAISGPVGITLRAFVMGSDLTI